MAKLEGVKTLDMVNGEITKVSYGGAEYVKTDSPVQEGDLFLLTEGHLVIGGDSGAFYMTNKRPDGGIEIPTMYKGNASYAQEVGCGIAFRKVAATTPSIEERVSSLESDVAALKGEAEYKRIGKSEAQAGDYVKFIETDDSSLTVGKMYVIKEIDYDGDPLITDDDDDENWAGTGEEFEIYRKVSATEPKPERLKVGEYAKVVDAGDYHVFSDGDIVEILEDSFAHENCEFARRLTDGETQYVPAKELVRATDEEVTEAKREAKWAEIGREVGEYKKGDIVRYDYGDNEICEVVDDTEDGRVEVQTKDYGICREKPDTLRLVTPVEARFDR
ncbi:hypothetical protein MOE50_04920 [Bacillus inaquosorum]|nr:hypothetical protein [Bacillus inaquosorum]MCY9008344.1 hypothetical protein [Bacillus inaquosorum]